MGKYLITSVLTICLAVANLAASQDDKIDAFDQRICGKALMRTWQVTESAYNCKYGQSYSMDDETTSNCSPRIADGFDVKHGEFPSAVRVKYVTKENEGADCGGTLIHSNLVITSAICIKNATSITVYFGSNKVHEQEEVKAIGWCMHKNYSTKRGIIFDLGIIKLAKKLDYIPGKVQPACLRLDIPHVSRAVCSHVGFGFYKNNTLTDRLKTIALARNCDQYNAKPSATCYARPKLMSNLGYACVGDAGSGLYCYDSCDDFGQRSFVVGALSGLEHTFCIPGRKGFQWFADFNGMSEGVREMIRTLLHGKDVGQHKCVSVAPRDAQQDIMIEPNCPD